jgi:hypothetical protein
MGLSEEVSDENGKSCTLYQSCAPHDTSARLFTNSATISLTKETIFLNPYILA